MGEGNIQCFKHRLWWSAGIGIELTIQLGQRSKPAAGQRDRSRQRGASQRSSPTLYPPLLLLLYSSVPQQEGPIWARSCSIFLAVKGRCFMLLVGVRLWVSVKLTTWTLADESELNQSSAVPSILVTCCFTMFNTYPSNISTEAKTFRGNQ